MFAELRRGVVFTVVMMALVGAGYDGVLWGVGRVAFPAQAEGSLIRRADGTPVGSRLIAQSFAAPEYFQPRPSGVDYNAAAAGGSNLGPSNPDLLSAVRGRLAAVVSREGAKTGEVPSELVTTSGSGLDPHITPAAAELQAARVARARGVDVSRVLGLVRAHTEAPLLGFIGPARVNVLELNVSLDDAFGVRR